VRTRKVQSEKSLIELVVVAVLAAASTHDGTNQKTDSYLFNG
jgi:hypothetical protein